MGKVAASINDIKPAKEMYVNLRTLFHRLTLSCSVDELVSTAEKSLRAANSLTKAKL